MVVGGVLIYNMANLGKGGENQKLHSWWVLNVYVVDFQWYSNNLIYLRENILIKIEIVYTATW